MAPDSSGHKGIGYTGICLKSRKDDIPEVIHARGTANKEAEQFFHITIQPDKEIVMILVTDGIKDAVLHALYQSAGLKTEGQGIAFSLPVDEVVGLTVSEPVKGKKDDNSEQVADKAKQAASKSADASEQ